MRIYQVKKEIELDNNSLFIIRKNDLLYVDNNDRIAIVEIFLPNTTKSFKIKSNSLLKDNYKIISIIDACANGYIEDYRPYLRDQLIDKIIS